MDGTRSDSDPLIEFIRGIDRDRARRQVVAHEHAGKRPTASVAEGRNPPNPQRWRAIWSLSGWPIVAVAAIQWHYGL